MNSSNNIEPRFALESTPSPSKTISRLSLLTALLVSQAYLIHAAFFAHALTPIGVYVIDRHTHLHLRAGQIGDIEEVFHWGGLLPTMLISFLVFVGGWIAARATARLLVGQPWSKGVVAPTAIDTGSLNLISPREIATAEVEESYQRST
jgi:hypothetical protein